MTTERPELPTTDEIVSALLVLRVEGPAGAMDVLAAAGLKHRLPLQQVPEVLNGVAIARADPAPYPRLVPTTDEAVSALLALGVEGPATALDVLSAAGLPVPPERIPEVLRGVYAARTARTDRADTGREAPSGSA